MKKYLLALLAVLIPLSASAYVVKPGDSLWNVARKFATDVPTLVDLNNIQNPDLIFPGQTLVLPKVYSEEQLGATSPTSAFVPRKYVEIQDTTLFAGAIIGDTTLTLDNFVDIYNNALSMDDFGTRGFGRINPEGDNISEAFSFTGITVNANGTYTLTGVSTTLAQYPYTASDGLVRSHGIGSIVRISNTAAFYEEFANKENDEIVDGIWHFTQLPTSTEAAPTQDSQLATKKYVDDTAFAGAPDASEAVKGVVEQATGVEAASSTAVGGGSTTAPLFIPTTLTTSTPGITGLYIPVSENDGKLNQSWLDLTESYAWTGLHTFAATTTFTTTTMDAATIVSSTITTLDLGGIGANQLIDGTDVPASVHDHSHLDSFVSSSPHQLTFGNSTSETTLWTVSIPANTLGTNGVVMFDAHITDFDIANSGANCEQFIANLKYGGSTIATFTLDNNNGSSITNMEGRIWGYLQGAGTTGTQEAVMYMKVESETDTITAGGNPTYEGFATGLGTASIDSTSAQTLLLTGDWNQAVAGCTITIGNTVITKHPND